MVPDVFSAASVSTKVPVLHWWHEGDFCAHSLEFVLEFLSLLNYLVFHPHNICTHHNRRNREIDIQIHHSSAKIKLNPEFSIKFNLSILKKLHPNFRIARL